MKSHRQIVQTDNRGRILLPKEYRSQNLFELETCGHQIILHALKAERVQNFAPLPSVFSMKSAWSFIKNSIFPKLKDAAEKIGNIETLVAYGSYARDEAFNNSDIDLAIFVKEQPNRRAIEKTLDESIDSDLKVLEQHRIFSYLSPVFISAKESAKQSSLAYSIATDGFAFYDPNQIFEKWRKEVFKVMKDKKVKRVQRGSSMIWEETRNG